MTRPFALKLTLLTALVSGLAVAVTCGTLVGLEVRRVRRAALEAAGAQARVIAANVTAALDFDDAEAGQATLHGLASVPEFAAAEISRTGGGVFARFEREGSGERPPLGPTTEPRIDGGWLFFAEPIVRSGERLGTLTLLYDFGPARRQLMTDITVAVGVALGALALSFVAARSVQRSLLRPVRELSSAAHRLASGEDFTVRAAKVSGDELGALTDVFNSMVRRLGEAEEVRRRHREMLEQAVAQRTAEVTEAQARLRVSERMASLGTLSAGLGHDIGNLLMPLRAHVGAIRQRVEAECSGLGPSQEDFAVVSRVTEYLQNLSSGLRLLAQDPAQVTAPREPTDLGSWWTATQPLLRSLIGGQITLELSLPDGLPHVGISKNLLTQAVFNLVQNAAQAMTPEDAPPTPGAKVRVWAERGAEGRVRIGVTDNGPGMDPDVRARCLEPYFTTKTRRISSGLGLTLVKGIVESVGGTLAVESEPGRGSTFVMDLPAATARQRRAPAIVTIREPRRRAMVTHLLSAMNYDVTHGDAGGGGNGDAGENTNGHAAPAVWVTDSLAAVPGGWHGSVVLLGDSSGLPAARRERTTVVDPATPLPALRRVLQKVVESDE